MSEVSCANCVGAGCSDMRVVLSSKDATRIADAGTNLISILPLFTPLEYKGYTPDESDEDRFLWSANLDYFDDLIANAETEKDAKFWQKIREQAKTLKSDESIFSIKGRCGFLQDDDSCGDYENRPEVCRGFPAGSISCLGFRERAGVGVPVELTTMRVGTTTETPQPGLS